MIADRRIIAGLLWITGAVAIARGDVIFDWSETTLTAIRTDRTAPPRAARALAMVHVAMFDAVNAIDGKFESYLPDDFGELGTESAGAAASSAAHDVLVGLFPAQSAMFDAVFDTALAALEDAEAAKTRGVALGRRVAAAMLALRADDGSTAAVSYTPGSAAGVWQPTPPALAPAVLPQWPNVTPFCVTGVVEMRRAGPPPLTSAEFTTAFNETKLLGSKTSTARTADQTQIALFWVDGPGTATPPGHWFQIARDVAALRSTTLEQNARLLALIGLAVCDAGICSWDNKYAYNDWRPITAIRAADSDGNPDTAPDPTWESFLTTPAFPSYVSGHSTFSGAASKILALFYESDEIAFTTTTDDVPGAARSYTRFSQAASEAGRSRIYGGIHWEYDNQDGLATGRELAGFIFTNFLRPVDSKVITIPADDIARCGPIGLFPLGWMMLGLMAMRRVRIKPVAATVPYA